MIKKIESYQIIALKFWIYLSINYLSIFANNFYVITVARTLIHTPKQLGLVYIVLTTYDVQSTPANIRKYIKWLFSFFFLQDMI